MVCCDGLGWVRKGRGRQRMGSGMEIYRTTFCCFYHWVLHLLLLHFTRDDQQSLKSPSDSFSHKSRTYPHPSSSLLLLTQLPSLLPLRVQLLDSPTFIRGVERLHGTFSEIQGSAYTALLKATRELFLSLWSWVGVV